MRQICRITKFFLKLSQNIPFFEAIACHACRSVLPTPTLTKRRHTFSFGVIVLNFHLRAEIIGFPTSTPIRTRRAVLKKIRIRSHHFLLLFIISLLLFQVNISFNFRPTRILTIPRHARFQFREFHDSKRCHTLYA